MRIEFSRTDLDGIEAGFGREWIVTNGLGSYASGTISGVNTRRYHGMLVAAIRPPAERVALLLRLNEAITIGGEATELMTSEFVDGTISPTGYRFIESFVLESGIPTWSFNVADHVLRRRVWMIPGHNVTVVRYRLTVGSGPVDLAIRPLCAARDYHALQRWRPRWDFSVEPCTHGIRVQASAEAPPLWLLVNGASFSPGGDWYWNYLLREERERGYDYVEDLYQPGTFHVTLQPGETVTLLASSEDPTQGMPDPDASLAAARMSSIAGNGARARRLPGDADWLDELEPALVAAADHFVVRRSTPNSPGTSQVSLIAGYHWFSDWGRDAMISLPGLLLTTGRLTDAASLLRCYASYVDFGMIPNRFSDSGEQPEYNTADATLLYFRALRYALDAGVDDTLLPEVYPRLKEVISWHLRGTRFGIGVDPADGLLRAGEADSGEVPTQLTWMDARVGNEVITPRVGKPVEINALWIDALDSMAEWGPRCGDVNPAYRKAADMAAASFARRFWNEQEGYLFDVVDGLHGDDASLRPNQLFALASRRRLVSAAQARSALRRVTEELLTPYGLRTLAPGHPSYIGRYRGDPRSRDRAYHQGTVWPWLLGLYVDAQRIEGISDERVTELLAPFHGHLREAGIGCISEIFDGDSPHAPNGCIAQAWSVAELLRIIRTRPPD